MQCACVNVSVILDLLASDRAPYLPTLCVWGCGGVRLLKVISFASV